MKPSVLIDSTLFEITISRLCRQLIENHGSFQNSAIIGLQPRGVFLARRLREKLVELTANPEIDLGTLDITFFRDDFRRREKPIQAAETNLSFSLEDKNVILVDDVFYTGRTIRAGLDALFNYGRPSKVELLVFIDRRFSRHLPIEPTYIGKSVDSIDSQRVAVEWAEISGKDRVLLYSMDEHE